MNRTQLLNDSEAGVMTALDGKQANMWTAMPAIVQSVNWSHMTVVVQLAIQGIQTLPNGTTQNINISPLVDCPLVFPSAGGFALTLPIAQGDEVLVVIASRCIDGWFQSGGFSNPPMELRMHDLSDGFCIPGPRSLPNVVPSISSVNAQLRNVAGTVYLEITPAGNINLVAPSGVHIVGDLTVTGEVTAGAIPLTSHLHTGITLADPTLVGQYHDLTYS